MADLHNIWQQEEALNDEQLMKYLAGNLSDEERHAIEHQMADDAFANDALEGLETVANKAQLPNYIDQLNRQLQKNINAKKLRKEKRQLKDNTWVLIAIVIILTFCVLGYYLLHLQLFK